jgi:hypothetical protein
MKAGMAVHPQTIDGSRQQPEPARPDKDRGGLSHADGRHLPTSIAAPGTT